jgi:hypothetical protein
MSLFYSTDEGQVAAVWKKVPPRQKGWAMVSRCKPGRRVIPTPWHGWAWLAKAFDMLQLLQTA